MIKPALLPFNEIKKSPKVDKKIIRGMEKIKHGGVKLQSLPLK
jgi:hypothetical protein